MIVSFGDRQTEAVFHGGLTRWTRRLPQRLIAVVQRKLDMLDAAAALKDLRAPPGNRLESLAGDLRGFHSIRVNDQWRLIFRWEKADAYEVRLVDYHR